eukprot:gnl/TRDRNA2_/TRDRNA2_80331_c0_seq1.p1 gnl/TRDRNA2_/TRDRNA2_80331_c0~~gnl/TRDRNA2_/TRDRNA2_80331_c0_seq1.p1  ORF type:complete len:719 (-),score=116.11 gnl/TRDRNA2_/TRDRNA2_80331_c0_seq1:94-2094(-)
MGASAAHAPSDSESSSSSGESSDEAAGAKTRPRRKESSASIGKASRSSAKEGKNSARSSCSSATNRSEETPRHHSKTSKGLCACCGSGIETGSKELVPLSASKGRKPRKHQDGPPSDDGPGTPKAAVAPRKEKGGEERSQSGARAGGEPATSGGFHKGDIKDDDSDGARSARSDFSVSTAIVGQHSAAKAQAGKGPGDAATLKLTLKAFVKEMVKGRDLHIKQPTMAGKEGALLATPCRLNSEVTVLLVDSAQGSQKIPLEEIQHVHHGLEALPLDLGFELDATFAVLELASGKCLSFNLGHPVAAEDFVLCFRLLTAMHRQQSRTKAVDDDARSECNTAIVQQTINCTPVSSTSNDPKEVKKMFKMFKETMRRGRDFYVVKPDGTLYDVECSLSEGHNQFNLRWDFKNRSMLLTDMLQVHSGQQASSLGLGFPLDERCATLEMQTGECITFKFGHAEACERFTLCMRILLEQKRPRFVAKSLDAAPGRSTSVVGSGSGVSYSSVGGTNQNLSARSSSSAAPRKGAGGRSKGVRMADEDNESPPAEDGGRGMVEEFVRQMIGGCRLDVCGPAGSVSQVKGAMDQELKKLQIIASDGSRREIAIAQVQKVHTGTEGASLGLEGLAIDSQCVTLELQTGDCVAFRFPGAKQRDQFAFCINAFATAHKQ